MKLMDLFYSMDQSPNSFLCLFFECFNTGIPQLKQINIYKRAVPGHIENCNIII